MAARNPAPGQSGSIQRLLPGTQLLVSLRGLDEKLKTTFVGLERGRHFLLRTPRPTAMGVSVYDHLYPGNGIVIRYLMEGNIWLFESTIQSYLVKPHPLVFVDYPKDVQAHSLRKEHRIDCRFPATLVRGDERLQCMILDLSRTGCGLTFEGDGTAPIPDLDETLFLDCPLFGARGEDRVQCVVRRVSRSNGTVNLGVIFSDLPEAVEEWIAGYVSQVLNIIER